MAKLRREIIACLISLHTGFCLVFYFYSTVSFSPPDGTVALEKSEQSLTSSIVNRKLLAFYSYPGDNITESPLEDVNCTKPDIEQFPRPLIDYNTRRKGGLAVHIFVSLYMFLGLAIICDEYFVPSLENICKSLNMQSDVAGATFMAAGSSAPELATAIIAVFVAKDDIGVGTVVGSAVFNIAFVIGVCGLFAGKVIHLNCWPMFRDCVFYLISILALLFSLLDETVNWFESSVFLGLYTLYIVFMFFNERVENWIKSIKWLSCFTNKIPEPINGVPYHPLPDLTQGGLLENCDKTTNLELESPLHPTEEQESSVFSSPEGGFRKGFWLLSIPILIGCYFTIPDCRKKRWKKWFFFTFLSACLWIGVLSYILVWMITIIGFTLSIKDTVMGLTFLAAGASIPDAISSLLVARDGLGDMAVSNAVGSNVFDILLCLGLPWFIQTALVEPGSKILVRSRGLTYSTLTLLLTIVFLLLATHLNKWTLDKKYGIILLIWYAIFMMIAIFYESSLFGSDVFPMCPSDY